jgi:hypothetical protein
MEELVKIIKKKYNNFDITPQHLEQIICLVLSFLLIQKNKK